MIMIQKSYWKLFETFKTEETVITEPPGSASEWVDHFSNLNIIHESFNDRVQEIFSLLEQQETINEFCENDLRTNIKELFDAALSLKSNKAVGFDSVSNEMLKCGFNQLQNCLIKVFNSILSNGTYPMEWKDAYITPVHKGGSLDDPKNYRWISILSCTA